MLGPASIRARQCLIDVDIIRRHAAGAEPALECRPDLAAVELAEPRDRGHGLVERIDHEAGTAPRRHAMTGVPQAIASIMTRPNGSGQSIGNSSAAA